MKHLTTFVLAFVGLFAALALFGCGRHVAYEPAYVPDYEPPVIESAPIVFAPHFGYRRPSVVHRTTVIVRPRVRYTPRASFRYSRRGRR